DDASSALLLVHLAQCGPGREECSVEVNTQHPLPFAEVEVNHGIDNLNARIADQNVESAKCFDYPGGSSLDLLLACHVHRHAHGALAAGVDFFCGGVRGLLTEVRDRNLRSLAREDGGYLLADSTRCAGDDGSFGL